MDAVAGGIPTPELEARRRDQESVDLSREAMQYANRRLTWSHDDDGALNLRVCSVSGYPDARRFCGNLAHPWSPRFS